MKRLALILVFFLAPLAVIGDTESDLKLLERSDVKLHAPVTFVAHLEITAGRPPRRGTTEVEVWHGTGDRVLVRFLDEKQEGKFLLSVDGELLFLSPGTRKPVKLPRAHRLRGAASLDHILGLSYSRDYAIASSESEVADDHEIVRFELTAATDDLPYPRVDYTVDVASARPIEVQHRLPSGKIASIVRFAAWAEEGLQPKKLEIKEPLKPGAPTEIEFVAVEAREVPDGLFSLEDSAARDQQFATTD